MSRRQIQKLIALRQITDPIKITATNEDENEDDNIKSIRGKASRVSIFASAALLSSESGSSESGDESLVSHSNDIVNAEGSPEEKGFGSCKEIKAIDVSGEKKECKEIIKNEIINEKNKVSENDKINSDDMNSDECSIRKVNSLELSIDDDDYCNDEDNGMIELQIKNASIKCPLQCLDKDGFKLLSLGTNQRQEPQQQLGRRFAIQKRGGRIIGGAGFVKKYWLLPSAVRIFYYH